MTIRLYNTLSRMKEAFVPLDATNVRMYVCGPTVYDYAHIGNGRPAIVFDVLFRLLRHTYGAGHVTYVRNITDIDDKINARAAERAKADQRNIPILDVLREITEATYGVYRGDVVALGCLEPTYMPRATEHVIQMIAMTENLIVAGYAYAAEGHVLFRVKQKADYGKLARRSLDDMIAGARVDVAPYKEDPMDFVLWKPSTPDQPGWNSPWGYGRPGWHLECSAMIEATMGETIDIHGGGIDLVFPHHENEIAQSEGAHHGHPLARVWMHNGFLNVEGEKMSKSLGNFVTINELLQDWPGEVLRLAMLMTHYRQPTDFSREKMKYAQMKLDSWYNSVADILSPEEMIFGAPSDALLEGLNDDLNVHKAIVHLDELDDAQTKQSISQLFSDLGFLGIDLRAFWSGIQDRHSGPAIAEAEIERAIAGRAAARARKDFKESDRIRDDLLTQGIVLKDGPQGTTWEIKR